MSSSVSGNSVGSGKNMGPPPSGSNANGHRKSSSLNRGWFEGTMEVISGMAPRPSTPSQPPIRPASAPNSPARGLGGFFGGGGRTSPHHHMPPHIDRTGSGGLALPSFPINRLPSQDSLDRSIHNESGHGKSTAQIIRDLKHHNSSLSAKMASMEKKYMNELAQVEAASSSKRHDLEQLSAKQKMKLMQYEQYKAAAESKMKEQDAELSKVKEESAFQRHSISDLKNQLYELQQDLDEQDKEGGSDALRRPHSDDGQNLPRHPGHSRSNSGTTSSVSTDDFQQLALENEELVKEVQDLHDQLMEYQGYDKKLKDMQRQLEVAQSAGIPPRSSTPSERPPLAPSKSRDQDDISVSSVSSSDQYRRQLQDAKDELEAQTMKLNQHESSVRDLEAEKESLAQAHSRRVQELEEKFAVLEAEAEERELAIREESQLEIDEIEARVREEQQAQVVELEEQLEKYAEKLAEVAATLAESRQQAKNQEQYRKDEAEDLRMIQDAHESEIVRLEKQLDEATKELELRDEELEEVKQKLTSSRQDKEDEKKLDEVEGDTGSRDLEKQLYDSLESIKILETKLEVLQNEHSEALTKLEAEKTQLSFDLGEARDKQVAQTEENPGSPLHRYWEEMTSKTVQVGALKEEITSIRQRLYESTEAGRLAEQKIQDLETELQVVRSQKQNSNQAINSEEEITKLKIKIEEMNILQIENESMKRELNEAKSTVETLDDDKQAMQLELNELVSSLVKEKEMQNQMTSQLESQEAELLELEDIKNRLEPLESEKLRLEREVEDLKRNKVSGNASVSSEAEIMSLNNENTLIKNKLKDRDTTIATLLRSSVVLENRIESLEAEMNETGTQKSNDEIMYLQSQLKAAKADAKRWRHALKDDGTTSGEYRYQISMLQKANEDLADTVQERDQAIQNLINQAMDQEKHIRDFKMRISVLTKEVESVQMKQGTGNESKLKAEIKRLQEESELFAGQIIEQDEEFKKMQRLLKKRNEQIVLLKTEVETSGGSPNRADLKVVRERDQRIAELLKKIVSLENQLHVLEDDTETKNLKAELDEMQEAAESNRTELRELRQQLWEAKDAAGAAGDLRVQLDQAKRELEEYKDANTSVDNSSKLRDLETKLQTRETVIAELREELSNALNGNEDLDIHLVNKNKALENELQSKLTELENLTGQLDASQSEMDGLKQRFVELKNDLTANKIQLEEASDSKAKLGHELSDSQARFGALQRELMDAINETSSDVELSKRNHALVQENASLSQKNKVLAQENASLGDLNNNLVEESKTLTNDNQVLCEELQSLSQQRTKEAVAGYDALHRKVEDLARTSDSLSDDNKRLVTIIENLKQQNADLERSLQASELEQLKAQLQKSELQNESFGLTLKEMEMENGSLREQFEVEMQAKNQQIYALEHTLHAQEQIVDTMRSEMDQIQSGMEHATRARRNEVEEMQQEVMQVEGRAMKQEREIVALKMQLEERKLEHKADVVKLKDALAKAMEEDSPLKQRISDLQSSDRMLQVRERLEHLKAKNTGLQEENLVLGGRLERAAIQIKAFELEKEQAREIEEENMKLRNQLKEYEQLLSRGSRAFRKAPRARAPDTAASDSEDSLKGKDNKKKKFGLFKRKGVDGSITEGQEEEEM